GGVNVFLHAKTGRLRYEKERDVLVLTLFNGKGEQGIEPISHQILFEETSVILPLKEILGRPEVFRRLDYMMWPELWEEYRTVGRSPSARAQKIKIQLEVQERLVMSLATLTFLTVAIPLGIWVGRSETSINLALAVGLAMAYYFSVMAFSWLEGKIDWRPDLLIWLPSLFLSLLGWILLRRLAKH
ncbi:MAG: LptF/LptG family permease, partial [Puniceicoccales bacterium]|nr:LptF/LptG family permease [Puniceicoccales bacterium]